MDAILNEDGACGVITHLAYSSSGTYLASASTASAHLTVALWDLQSASRLCAFEPIILEKGEHVISFLWDQPSEIVVGTNIGRILIADANASLTFRQIKDVDGMMVMVSVLPDRLVCYRSGQLKRLSDGQVLRQEFSDKEATTVTSCTLHEPSGLVFLASNKMIFCFDLQTNSDVPLEEYSFQSAIQGVVSSPTGNKLAVSLRDKSIRILDFNHVREEDAIGADNKMSQLVHRHKLHDVVDRWPWSQFGFSHDGELVWGTFNEKGKHMIYLWESNTGALNKVIDGPKEDLVVALWNPRLPNLITGGTLGTLYRWTPDFPVRWTALVPGLEEIQENVEYIEREDEFDLTVEEEYKQELARRKMAQAIEFDEPVDVLTKDTNSITIEPITARICVIQH